MNKTCSEPPHRVQLYAEDASGSIVQLEAIRSRRYSERFLTMFPQAMQAIAAMDRPACYHRTLFHLLSVLDPIQYRRVSAREIAQATTQSQSSAERSLAMLEADHVILTNGELTGAKARRLNNRLCWASTADRHGQTSPDPMPEDARGR